MFINLCYFYVIWDIGDILKRFTFLVGIILLFSTASWCSFPSIGLVLMSHIDVRQLFFLEVVTVSSTFSLVTWPDPGQSCDQ